MGVVSPVGNNTTDTWQNLVQGNSGVRAIAPERFDTSDLTTKFAAQLTEFDPSDWVPNQKDIKKMDPFIVYSLAAAKQAIQEAGLSNIAPQRKGVAIGSGIGGIGFIEAASHTQIAKGSKRISPFFIPGSIANMACGYVSMLYDCQGPSLTLATACTTGTHMIGLASRLIQSGDADVMICGAAEAPITPLCMGGFCAARALSTNNAHPEKASRPWDKDRDGFVMGEGAGILVIESLQHAIARHAPIYAEVSGFGMSADAHHITLPQEQGQGAYLAMQTALADAGLEPQSIGYINAHGTSTQAGDLAEVHAIKRLFGDHASKILISSTKSMTGHLLGAAGAVEAIFSILALQNGRIPPTINLDNPDTGCDLDFVQHQARYAELTHVLSNSFGFGGTNGSLIFSKYA